MHETQTAGRRLDWALRSTSLLLGLFILVYPYLPLAWFLVTDPATGEVRTFNRSHITRVPFHCLWAMEGYRQTPTIWRAVSAGVLVALAVVPGARRTVPEKQPALSRTYPVAPLPVGERVGRGAKKSGILTLPPRLPGREGSCGIGSRLKRLGESRRLVPMGGAVAATLLYLLRVPYARNVEFADAPILLNEVDVGMVFAAEVLTYRIFAAVRALLGLLCGHPGGLLPIVLTSCLSGGVFVAAMTALARSAGRFPIERWTLWCGATLAGYTGMFFGYVETTQVELAAMAVYFAAASRTIRHSSDDQPTRWLVVALVALSIALQAHAAGILLLPSAIVLLAPQLARPKPSSGDTAPQRLLWRNAGLAVGLVVVPYVLAVVLPFYAQGEFGNMLGGGDGIMFVPWRFDPAHPPSRYVYYALFSPMHLADLASTLLVAAPLALPLCVWAGWRLVRSRTRLSDGDRRWLLLLAAAAGPCLVVPLVWNHDLGMWGDWNLATCYLFPLNLLAWSLFQTATDRWRAAGWVARLLAIQVALALGLLLQLW